MGLVSLVGQQGERDCYFNFYYIGLLNSVQSLSRVWLFVTPWTTQWNSPWTISWSTTGFSVHHQLPEPAQTHMHWSVMPSNHLILCHPLFLLPLIFPNIRVFSNESVLHIRWPKYWSFSFSISPSNEYSGQISFRMDWFDLLAVQETLKSFLTSQFKSINSLVLSFHIHTWLLERP